MTVDKSKNNIVLGVDLGSQHTISSLLIVEDMRAGDAWEMFDKTQHLYNVQVYVGDHAVSSASYENVLELKSKNV